MTGYHLFAQNKCVKMFVKRRNGMFEEYKKKLMSFLKTPGNKMGRHVFTTIDLGISIEAVLATICTIAGIFLSRHFETASAFLYGIAFLLLAWEPVTGAVGDMFGKHIYFRYILLTLACVMAMFSGDPLIGLLSVLIIRAGNVLVSFVLIHILKKVGYDSPEEFALVKWKSTSETRLGRYVMKAHTLLPFGGLCLLAVTFIVFLDVFVFSTVLGF